MDDQERHEDKGLLQRTLDGDRHDILLLGCYIEGRFVSRFTKIDFVKLAFEYQLDL